MKLEHFYYLYEISRAGSINRAAKTLFISQPHLSNMLKELEDELGVKLFQRTPKGMVLTYEGKQFTTYARQIIELVDKVNALKASSDKAENEIFSICSIYAYTLLDLYENYRQKKTSSGVRISYSEMPVNQIIGAVYERQSDIGFMYYYSTNEESIMRDLLNRNMSFYLLANEPFCVLLNSEHPFFNRDSVTIEEMCNYSFITETRSYEQHKKTFPSWFNAGHVAPVFFDNNRGAMYYLLKSKNSFFMGQYCLNITNPFVVTKQLRYVPLSDTPYRINTGYVIRNDTRISPTMQDFLKYVTDFFDENRLQETP